MLEFYFLPDWILILTSVIAALSVIMQAVAIVLDLYRHRPARVSQWLESLVQFALLAHCLVLVYLIAQVRLNSGNGFILSSGQHTLRVILFLLIALPSAALAVYHRKLSPLSVIPAVALILPAVESLSGKWFPILYWLALLFILIRGLCLVILYERELKSRISAYSIKAAIDALHTGILFCRPAGNILLINTQMQKLMVTLSGDVMRNGKRFYEDVLAAGNCTSGCTRAEAGDSLVYILPDQTVWLFAKTDILIGKQHFVQLSASDITQQWQMTAELQAQDAALQQQSDKLKETIANLQEICRQEETLRIKSHFHDVLGQRIALLLWNLREGRTPNEALLQEFADQFSKELQTPEAAEDARQKMDVLRRVMQEIGVTLRWNGVLPSSPTAASLCADIATEAATNAVRHGFATEIWLDTKRTDGMFALQIENNGRLPQFPLAESGGLADMRRKLAAVGGTLEVHTQPRFVLSVLIPEENGK